MVVPSALVSAAFLIVVLLIPALCRLAVASGFVDRPGGRKKHERAVPPVGGLAIFPAYMAVAAISGMGGKTVWFLTALALLLVVGALDDRFHVLPRIKFAAQIGAAALIVIPGGASVVGLGNFLGFGPMGLGWAGPVFAMTAVVLLINGVNLMDGLDGLVGGMSFIVLFWLAVCGAGMPVYILMAALAGFLVYNLRYPGHPGASVFLGDAGSMALGLSLAWFAIRLSQGSEAIIRPAAVAWLLALPIYDTCAQFARRVSQGRHPFDPDHDHFHHHFIYAGLTHGQATAAILLLCFVTGGLGVGGIAAGVPEFVLGWLWAVLLLAHIFMSLRPHRYRRLLLRLRGGKEQ